MFLLFAMVFNTEKNGVKKISSIIRQFDQIKNVMYTILILIKC